MKIGDLDQDLKGVAIGDEAEAGWMIPGIFFLYSASDFAVAAHHAIIEIEGIGYIKNRDVKTNTRLVILWQNDLQAVGAVAHPWEIFPIDLVTGPIGWDCSFYSGGFIGFEIVWSKHFLPVEQPLSIEIDDGLVVQNSAGEIKYPIHRSRWNWISGDGC